MKVNFIQIKQSTTIFQKEYVNKLVFQKVDYLLQETMFEAVILSIYCYQRSPVISYPGYFVPKSFRTILVISYPLLFSIWSFRTQFGHFVPSLVISYLLLLFSRKTFGHFVHVFYCFVPKSYCTRSHFIPILVIWYPGHFVPSSKLGTN